jgi:hypothetical protein
VYEITGIFAAYDERDSKLAHAFGVAHPALHGETYGARLHRVLADRGLVPGEGAVVLVDADPDLAHAWQSSVRSGSATGETIRVTQRASTQREPGVRDLVGRPTAIPLPDGSAALVVANEVALGSPARADDPLAAERLRLYRIEATDKELFNVGAWRMLEEIARVLAPGGAAVVVGRGALDERVEETIVRNRPEVSLHFGHLIRVADRLGLDAQFVPLAELLDFDLGASWLARHSFEALRARLVGEGKVLAARAWTQDTLALPWPAEGIDWVSLREEGPGPLVATFGALVLRRS